MSASVSLKPIEKKPVFALAIPHTPWRPERAASLETMLEMLGSKPPLFRVFGDKSPNWVWSRELWRWGVEMGRQGATHLVQLQDDLRPMSGFWSVLEAMISANPLRWIGLHVNHPVVRSLAHCGRRWFATRAWLVGPQYVAPLEGPDSLDKALLWLEEHEAGLSIYEREHEDVSLSAWISKTGRDLYHPIPAIADVDLTIGSTYAETPGHIDDHRRPCVTWQGYSVEMLKDPSYWQLPNQVELFGAPGLGLCVICNERPATDRSKNLIGFCDFCLLEKVAERFGVNFSFKNAKDAKATK
jgi:hypothetical protein